MKVIRLFALTALLGLGWLLANVGAAEQMAPSWGKAYSFQQLMGMAIKNQQEEDLGRVHDMVIDSQGHVPFAVLSHGGFLGVGGKLIAVPFSALTFEQKHLVLNATKERLESAPAFRLSDLSNQKWAEDVYRYFGQQPYWTEGGAAAQEEPMEKTTLEFEYYEFGP